MDDPNKLSDDGRMRWAERAAADLDVVRRQVIADRRRNGSDVTEPGPVLSVVGSAPLGVQHLEDGFWESRESLTHVYTAALARMASPWATLGYAAARVLALVRPNATLPPVIGDKGSLNWFAVIAALSGGGKGAAEAVGRGLVPGSVHVVNPGSGEGVVQAYATRNDAGKVDGQRESVMFDAAEVDSVAALATRSAATLMPVLRAGFDGARIGFGYADRGKAFTLDAHSYRMTLVISVQPARVGFLLDGAGGGTPQRFMWFPATDSRVTADTPWFPGPLRLPEGSEWSYPRDLSIPAETERFIKAERVKAMRGDQDHLDGHAVFCREKFAFALALLDGRIEMTSEDWELSGVAATVSSYIRGRVAELHAAGLRREAAETGALRGVSFESADNEKTVAHNDRVARVRRWVVGKLDDAGGTLTNRDMSRAVASRDRPVLHEALRSLIEHDRIEPSDDGKAYRLL